MGASERMFQIVRATNTLARLIAPGRRNRFFPLCNCELQRAPTVFPQLMQSSQQGGTRAAAESQRVAARRRVTCITPRGATGAAVAHKTGSTGSARERK